MNWFLFMKEFKEFKLKKTLNALEETKDFDFVSLYILFWLCNILDKVITLIRYECQPHVCVM